MVILVNDNQIGLLHLTGQCSLRFMDNKLLEASALLACSYHAITVKRSLVQKGGMLITGFGFVQSFLGLE